MDYYTLHMKCPVQVLQNTIMQHISVSTDICVNYFIIIKRMWKWQAWRKGKERKGSGLV